MADVTGHHPGFKHGVTLPVTPLILVVLLHGGKTHSQGTAVAIRSQAHINPEDKTIRILAVQHADQPLPEAQKKFLTGQHFFAAQSLSLAGIGQDQVDVRRQVKIACAQFAHAQHHHLLRPGSFIGDVGAVGRAQSLAAIPVEPVQSSIDAGIGQGREVCRGFRHGDPAVEVKPDNPHHLLVAMATQDKHQRLFVVDSGECIVQALNMVVG